MAGSWNHMTTRSGKLLNNKNFCGMIENLGDAYEAAEECYGMVQVLAHQLALTDPGTRDRREWVRWAAAHHDEGLGFGGRQQPS